MMKRREIICVFIRQESGITGFPQKLYQILQITLNSEKLQDLRNSHPVLSGIFPCPGELVTTGRRIPSWQLLNDVAPIPVTDRNGLFKGVVNDSVETITLSPYGFTKVRIVAFPIVP